MLGLGVVTYNRRQALIGCVEGIRRHTHTPHKLVIADDGSTDGTREWCQSNNLHLIGQTNKGPALNWNRVLWTLYEAGCDPIIVLEDDTHPWVDSWEREWMKAARLNTHVNFGHLGPECPVDGSGHAYDPLRCICWGACCIATSRKGISQVGYFDPRFYASRYGSGHGEWTFRFERLLNWKKYEGRTAAPCLRCGVKMLDFGSHGNEGMKTLSQEIERGIDPKEPIYRLPWRDDEEKKLFLSECQSGENE